MNKISQILNEINNKYSTNNFIKLCNQLEIVKKETINSVIIKIPNIIKISLITYKKIQKLFLKCFFFRITL